MADEIVNKLGLNVEDALGALQRLDDALQASGSAFQTFGATLDGWNSQADGAVAQMKAMPRPPARWPMPCRRRAARRFPPRRLLGRLRGFWLPPGMEAETQRLNDALKNRGHHGHGHGRQNQGRRHHWRDGASRTPTTRPASCRHLGHALRVVMTQLIVPRHESDSDALREAVEQVHRVQRRIARGPDHRPADRRQLCLSHQRGRRVRQAVQHSLEGGHRGPVPDPLHQFTAMSQRTDIMTASMKLAKVGVMDFHEAILLVTGTLNAYGLSSDQAESVAAKFFTTIQLVACAGRNWAAVMGQVIAHRPQSLGIGVEFNSNRDDRLTIGGTGRAQRRHGPARGHDGAAGSLPGHAEGSFFGLGLRFRRADGPGQGFFRGHFFWQAGRPTPPSTLGSKSPRRAQRPRLGRRVAADPTGAKAKVEDAVEGRWRRSTPGTRWDKVYSSSPARDSEKKLTSTINKLQILPDAGFGAGLTHRASFHGWQRWAGLTTYSAAIQALVPSRHGHCRP